MAATASSEETRMQAIVRREYAGPDALELSEIDRPVVDDDEVLVRVHAVSVNPVDWHSLIGWPYLVRLQGGLRRPKDAQLGVDYAGTVVEVGRAVTQFRPGDEVFGCRNGAFAEYVRAREERAIVPKPANVTFEDAAAVGVAALTALQGLRDKGHLQPGQKVLINGASGGVGTYAVQIANALGAEGTGVCSTRNVELVRSLGSDHVVDYTQEDFTREGRRYDLLLDIAGGRSWSEYKRVLEPEATLVQVGGPKRNRFTGLSIRSFVGLRIAALFGSRDVRAFIAKTNKEDLTFLCELLEAGKLRSAIDRRYEGLAQVPDALAYLGEGHARAKVVVTLARD